MSLIFTKHEKLNLRRCADFSEKWLHDRICEDPTILGLGDVEVLDRERVQQGAGRLDVLLYDAELSRRYEVEIMLGPTDPSHIIRCIEYWDIERRRYPAYEHVAVLIAEQVTTRFLNVMALMSGNIPLIAIQLDALRVGEHIVLNFVHVLNQTELRRDDLAETGGEEVGRAHWEARASTETLQLCDRVLEMINQKANPRQELAYRKHYIGLSAGAISKNFVWFGPRKNLVHIAAWVSNAAEWIGRFEEAGIAAVSEKGGSALRVPVKAAEFARHEEQIRELVHQATEEFQAEA